MWLVTFNCNLAFYIDSKTKGQDFKINLVWFLFLAVILFDLYFECLDFCINERIFVIRYGLYAVKSNFMFVLKLCSVKAEFPVKFTAFLCSASRCAMRLFDSLIYILYCNPHTWFDTLHLVNLFILLFSVEEHKSNSILNGKIDECHS